MNKNLLNNKIFITGGTGYIGSRLITVLIKNEFEIFALTRKGSEKKLPSGCNVIFGNALDSSDFENQIRPCETYIHLIGTAHPGPWKGNEFRKVDLVSIQQAVPAALNSGVRHFIYLSVAHPAPVMKDYTNVRLKGEDLIIKSGINASFIRPWYVTGPGHYWPNLFIPVYKFLELIPSTRDTARRLGLVRINQINSCILHAVKNPPDGICIFDVKDIKKY